jgi:acyl carrier protein
VVIRRTAKVASVEERLIDVIVQQHGVGEELITRESHFENDLGFDSLDKVEFVMEVEEEFNISIPDDAADKIETVGQAIDQIEQTVESRETSAS